MLVAHDDVMLDYAAITLSARRGDLLDYSYGSKRIGIARPHRLEKPQLIGPRPAKLAEIRQPVS